ncbi:MAG: ATP-binding protein, partial [Halobacteria archaeon]|nr:ATP-binding protein [Halobacteria archaeon]
IEMLESEIEGDDLQEHIDGIKQQIKVSLNRADTARNLEEVLDEGFEIPKRSVRLDSILREKVEWARDEFDDAEFSFEELDKTEVIADEYLGKVFEILLENAVTHNDKEKPVVEIGMENESGEVTLGIADNGKGVSDHEIDLIFGREEVNQIHHGQGISLYFCDMIVDKYDGEIWVEDNEPEGAVFKLTLQKA